MIKRMFKNSPIHIKLFLIVVFILSFGFYANIFALGATPPSGGYAPGSESDPDCAPGDVDCVVKIISGGIMIYPSAGISVSDGSAWDTSIIDNSANWNTAYSWGDHSLMGYVTGTPWAGMGYITDGNTGWDNSYGFITGYTETDPIFEASVAYDIVSGDITNWDSKQAALVSGTNIKTINGSSILGSGDLSIGGLLSDADFNTKGGTDAGLNLVAGVQHSTFLGYEAGKGGVMTNVADYNTGIGSRSLSSLTTGNNNTANGYFSLYRNTVGNYNSAYGVSSLFSNVNGSGNTSMGFQSLYSNTSGSYNTASGYLSLNLNTTGAYNVAVGDFSLYSNTTGGDNTAIGSTSLRSNTTGIHNTANGFRSLYANTTGSYNTASGSNSLRYSNGNFNTASGYQSLYFNTTGSNNTTNGYQSLYSNTTGYSNTANGGNSLLYNTIGTQNTADGYNSLFYNTTGSSNTAVGYESLSKISMSISAPSLITGVSYTIQSTGTTDFTVCGALDSNPGTIFIHNGTLCIGTGQAASNSNNNIGLGYQAGVTLADSHDLTDSSNSTFLGANTKALANNSTNEIVIGYNAIGNGSNTATIGNSSLLRTYLTGINLKAGTATAGTAPLKFASGILLTTPETGAVEFDGTHFYGTIGSTRYQLDQQSGGGGLLSDADLNTVGGTNAGLNLVAGAQYNTFLGYEAGKGDILTDSADNNTAIGSFALSLNTTGFGNTAVGMSSLGSNNEGYSNTAIGIFSLGYNNGGYSNTAIGANALLFNVIGIENTATGVSSLSSNTDGYKNTANGANSLYSNTIGYSNTAIGMDSLVSNTEGYENTALGSESLYSNTLGYGNATTGYNSLYFNTIGTYNVANGYWSLYNNVTGNLNTAIGTESLSNSGKTVSAGSFIIGISYTIKTPGNTDFISIGAADNNSGTVFIATGVGSGTGTASSNTDNNTALGFQSGTYAGSGLALNTASFNSLYLGYGTRASANGNNNEIVIGYNTIGNGSNTTTLGTDNVLYVGGAGITGKAARFTNSAGYCDIDPLTTALVCTSDINLKKNINTLNTENNEFSLNTDITIPTTILEKILLLTPVTYNWKTEKDTDSKHVGLIAQETEQLFPDIVMTDSNTDVKSIAYSNLIPYTIKAIQELNLKVEGLSAFDQDLEESFVSILMTFFEEKIILIKELVVKTLHIDGDVCVDDICITKDQFKQMLIDNGGESNQTEEEDHVAENYDEESDVEQSENEEEENGMEQSENGEDNILDTDESEYSEEIIKEESVIPLDDVADENDLPGEVVEGENGGDSTEEEKSDDSENIEVAPEETQNLDI